jgi:hypothetical protein
MAPDPPDNQPSRDAHQLSGDLGLSVVLAVQSCWRNRLQLALRKGASKTLKVALSRSENRC